MPPATDLITAHRPPLDHFISLYKHLHAHPELSHHESSTAALIASALPALVPSLTLHASLGGHGLLGIHRHGAGPTVLLRADMDALPVAERTGLEYASAARDGGRAVMHACGHDVHVAALLGCAALLAAAEDGWAGTAVYLFQPAEEKGSGARAMVADGLYARVLAGEGLVPDVVLGGHVMPFRAGWVGTTRGVVAPAAESVEVTVWGRGGHASAPHRLVDPVVLASAIVLRLQTLVSREVDPADHAVVTVASLQAGDAENVVADSALLKVDIRAMTDGVRRHLLQGVERIVRAECTASRCEREPEFKTTRTFPVLRNDDGATEKIEKAFLEHFGDRRLGQGGYDPESAGLGASEDFGELATAIDKPSVFWTYGSGSHEKWDAAERAGRVSEDIPGNHSALFAPQILPTLQIAIDAYAAAALSYLKKD